MQILAHFSCCLLPQNIVRRHRDLLQLADVDRFGVSKAVTKLFVEDYELFEMLVVLHEVKYVVEVNRVSKLSVVNEHNNWHVVQLGTGHHGIFESACKLDWLSVAGHIDL